MKITGVIFDLDGVIVSTDHFHYLGWKRMADEEGIYFDEIINNRLRGVSRMQSLEIILERSERSYTDEQKLILADRKNRYYVEYLSMLDESSILPGVAEVLQELKRRGIRIAIGSSSKNTGIILKRIGMDEYFDAVADGNGIKNSKPHPEVFLLAGQMLGMMAENLIVVEDALAGIDAANAAGMVSVAISDASGYEKASYSLNRIGELLNLCPEIA